MPAYISPILLGRPRKELSFTALVDELQDMNQSVGSMEKIMRTSSGEAFKRVFRRQTALFRVRNGFPVSDSLKGKLEGLRVVSNEPLSFVFADDWPIFSDRYVMEDQGGGSGTSIDLTSSPYTRLGTAYKAAGGGDTDIIKISRVSLLYDVGGAQADTNLFSSYAAATRTVTLTGSQFAGVEIFVNWTYRGAEVLLGNMSHRNRGGHVSAGLPLWDISLRLDGV